MRKYDILSDINKSFSNENETPEMELEEYKQDFLEMNIGSLNAIMRHAQELLNSLGDESVKNNLTESWLQGKIAITEDYMRTIHDFVKYVPSDDDNTFAADKPGLWENIRKKKEREGKKYRPAKPGDKDRPDPEAWKKAQSLWKLTVAEYDEGQMQREQLMKMHHQLMEIEEYLEGVKFEDWTKDMISKAEIYIQNIYDFVEARKGDESYAAEYQGRKVQLG